MVDAQETNRDPETFTPRLVPAANLAEFSTNIQALLESLGCREGTEASEYDCKRHVRFNAANYDQGNPAAPFRDGAYMAYYNTIYGANTNEQNKLSGLIPILDEVSQAINSNMSEEGLYKFLVAKWNQLADNFVTSSEDSSTHYILWKIFEPVIRGDMQVAHLNDGQKRQSYLRLGEEGASALTTEAKQNAYTRFLDSINLSIQPSFEGAINNDESLNPQLKTNFLSSYRSDGIVTALSRNIDVIAFSDTDNSEEYFNTIEDFLDYLIDSYTKKQRGAESAIAYLNCIKEHHLPALRAYCNQMREFKQTQPYAAALFLEAYLIKHKLLSDSDEPDLYLLFEEWSELQELHEQRIPCSELSFKFKKKSTRYKTPVVIMQHSGSIQDATQQASSRAISGPFSSVPRPQKEDTSRTVGYLPAIDDSTPPPKADGGIFDTPVPGTPVIPAAPSNRDSGNLTKTMALGFPALDVPTPPRPKPKPVQPTAVEASKALPQPASSIEALASGETPPENLGTSQTILHNMALATTAEQKMTVNADSVRALFTHQFESQKSRRHALQELYKFLHDTESEEDKRVLVSAFVETLMEKPHADPAFSQTSSVCEAVEIKKPKGKNVTPGAFLSAYGELDESNIDDAPEEIRERLKQLLEISKHLSLIDTKFGASIHMIDVPAMDDTEFQMMCRNIFIQLKRIRDEIYGKWNTPGTWGKPFKYRKTRKFYENLHKAMTAQLAIVEQLMFTEGSIS